MKKFLALMLVVLFVCCFTVNAVELTLGLKGGLAMADLYGDNVADIEQYISMGLGLKSGFSGGGFADIGIIDMISIQPEVLYLQKGAKGSREEGGVTGSVIMSLNYLEVPLLLKFKPPLSPKIDLEIFAGPAFGFNLAANSVGKMNGIVIGEEDMKDDISSMEVGVAFGGGLDFALGSAGMITIEGRYTMGLISAWEEEDVDVKNKDIVLMMGYGFPLGK